MKNEKFYEAMENINDELILGAIEEPKKQFGTIKKLRWIAVAACIALLMAVPVMAEVFGFTLDFDAIQNYWSASTNAKFAAEEYSEEVRSVKGQEYFNMQDIFEAEEFLGIDLPDNAVLEKSKKRFVSVEYFESGTEEMVHCNVFVGENEGNLLGTHTDAWYTFGENSVNVCYKTICEQNPVEGGGGFGYSFGDTRSKSEKYVTPSGRECEIVSIEGEYDYQEMAVAEVNRVLVSVMVYGQDKESVRSTVTEILDAYK